MRVIGNIPPILRMIPIRLTACSHPAALIRRQQGMTLVVVAAIFQHSPAVIITRHDSGLTTPQDLKGKRIMLTPETDPETLAMLVEEGIAPQSVTIIPHNWGVEDLIAGRVDGQTAYLTNEPYLLKKQGVETTLIRPLHYGIDFYGDCIVTTEAQVRDHSDRLNAFLKAVKLGWTYAMDHPREIAELIRSRYAKEKDVEPRALAAYRRYPGQARNVEGRLQSPGISLLGAPRSDRIRETAQAARRSLAARSSSSPVRHLRIDPDLI